MNRYKAPGYFTSLLAGLFFLTAQGVFASDLQGSGNSLSSTTVNEDPLMLPEFKSGALQLAQKEAEAGAQTGTAPAQAKSSGGDLATQATNPIANLMQFQFQNTSKL